VMNRKCTIDSGRELRKRLLEIINLCPDALPPLAELASSLECATSNVHYHLSKLRKSGVRIPPTSRAAKRLKPKRPSFSPRKEEILKMLEFYWGEKKCSPTMRDLGTACGLSASNVRQNMIGLQDLGLIDMGEPRSMRSVKVLDDGFLVCSKIKSVAFWIDDSESVWMWKKVD